MNIYEVLQYETCITSFSSCILLELEYSILAICSLRHRIKWLWQTPNTCLIVWMGHLRRGFLIYLWVYSNDKVVTFSYKNDHLQVLLYFTV